MHSEPPSLTTTSRQWRRSIALFSSIVAILSLMLILGIICPDNELMEWSTASAVITRRKLLHKQDSHASPTESKARKHEGGVAEVEPKRIWSEKCSISDIVVSQGQTAPLPNGIPMYTVEIMNVCNSGCIISNIHLKCEWFGSARVVNPHIFKRLGFNDCLVNDGRPLSIGQALSFQYANTYRYPLSVASVECA